MQPTTLSPLDYPRQRWFWLVALAAMVAAVYLGLLDRINDTSHLGMSGLFFLGAASLIWDDRHKLTLETDRLSTLIGGGLVLLTLLYSHYLLGLDSNQFSAEIATKEFFICRITPLVSLFGVTLMASGLQNLRQFWRPLAIVAAMGVPSVFFINISDISPITARFSHFLMLYGGIDAVLRDNIYIYLNLGPNAQGAVKVYEACSGIEAMNYLFGLSLTCLIMFPLRSRKLMAITPIIALGMGFIINSFRVVLMAILTAIQNDTAFDYWHDGKGSLTFGMVAVLSLGGFYMLMMEWDRYQFKQNKAKPGEFSDRSPQFQPLSDDYLIPPDLDVSVQDLELDPDLDLLPPSGETPSLGSPDV